jgi:general secretion pathway protein E
MEVPAPSFASAINGIVAQRLVRLICDRCITPIKPAAELLLYSGIDATRATAFEFRHGTGCSECRGTGYKGRKAIAELLTLNDELREMIVAKASLRQLRAEAQRAGMRSLREAALDLVRNGETTLEEINRVTFVA